MADTNAEDRATVTLAAAASELLAAIDAAAISIGPRHVTDLERFATACVAVRAALARLAAEPAASPTVEQVEALHLRLLSELLDEYGEITSGPWSKTLREMESLVRAALAAVPAPRTPEQVAAALGYKRHDGSWYDGTDGERVYSIYVPLFDAIVAAAQGPAAPRKEPDDSSAFVLRYSTMPYEKPRIPASAVLARDNYLSHGGYSGRHIPVLVIRADAVEIVPAPSEEKAR